MHFEILTLRLMHVLAGIFWMGSGLFTSFFLIPALTLTGSPPGPLFAALERKRLFAALPAAAAVTVLSGLRLMWVTSGCSFAAYVATPTGRTFAFGGAAAVTAFVASLAARRLGEPILTRLHVARRDGDGRRAVRRMSIA